jgi:hypothetical protein
MRLFLFAFLFVGWVMPAVSSDIAGTIKGDRLTWQSAQTTSDGLKPAIWDVPLRLPAADKVVPGGPASTAEHTLTLSGTGGSVNVPLTIVGMSYQLSSRVGTPEETAGMNTVVSGSLATVKGAGIGNKIVTLSSLSSPFTHYRPVIKPVVASVWLAAFKTAKLNKGIYQGAINYLIPYNYYRDGVLVRNTLQTSLTIKIEYNPSQLSAVSVSGGGVISPQYYGYPERLVGGTTAYVINATGVFPNGVRIGLKNTVSSGSRYQLLSQTTSPQTGIDYSVQCTNGCDGATQIITDGAPNINSTNNRLKMRSSNNVSAQATITVSFSNKKLNELNSDTYLGSFVLIFEAGV